MASFFLLMPLSSTSMSSASAATSTSSFSDRRLRYTSGRCFLTLSSLSLLRGNSMNLRRQTQVVCMAPEEEKITRRSPLDFPIEWERPKPGRRPDIFPQFSPMKTPLPPPLPADPPEEEEEEEEKKEEEEEDPDREDPDKPEKQ